MASPFPGMDPYLEAHWGDVHTSLALYARDQLAPQLPPSLVARVEEYLAVESDEELRPYGYYPDVERLEQEGNGAGLPPVASGTTRVAVAEPVLIPLIRERPTLHSLRIYDPDSGNRVIKAIELLSPVNKTNDTGRKLYRRKQRDFVAAGVNLVEIDLIRAGEYVLAPSWSALPIDCRGPYRISVVRSGRDHAEVYRISLRERLPAIRIPLRPGDADVVADLQPLVDRCYTYGGYERNINYRAEPKPPLQGDDVAWVDELLRSKGKR